MEWKTFLKEKEIKVTKGRVALLNILESSDSGLSADDLYDECKRQGVNLNLSTIYRSLELFEENGVIKRIAVGNGPSIYAMKKESHEHILKCDICNRLVKIPCPIDQIEEIIKKEVGFSLTEHKLELKGICDICKNKKR
ncbi:Fur family transcriptional regulator [Clostridium septicum]|uniref:Transcriptional repressor n=1 Tax=Clostridium septicum TaxID=1504 RepID=A0A9N7JJR2_CLOSE|nr:Fur family transcriptional regulator [Clostridium septicum]AYE33484.1 transcriptional repressor [Clostridium septicum]MDU1314904.1 Fur family transcriptional regulator [Clostridium septicum]QAS61655.1 transcriptional repressor [Clostridium septicum]UEC21906.1 transcriptional repressor [Clostridium septicum]USS00063.1 transcriptional repressor [Clostridium septicum]